MIFSIDREKSYDKIQLPFMIEFFRTLIHHLSLIVSWLGIYSPQPPALNNWNISLLPSVTVLSFISRGHRKDTGGRRGLFSWSSLFLFAPALQEDIQQVRAHSFPVEAEDRSPLRSEFGNTFVCGFLSATSVSAGSLAVSW